MNRIKSLLYPRAFAVMAALLLLVAGASSAQQNSNAVNIPLQMTITSSITVATTAPGTVILSYNAGSGTASSTPFNVTTTWNSSTPITNLATYLWLGSATGALTGSVSGVAIPSSKVFVVVAGGANPGTDPCTFSTGAGFGVAGAACGHNAGNPNIDTMAAPANVGSSTFSVQFTLQSISNQQADVYNGTATIQAQMND